MGCFARSLRSLGLAAALLIALAPPALAQAVQRDLWIPGESRFIRQWAALGPVPGGLAEDDPALAAALASPTGVLQPTAGEPPRRWIAQASWSDVTDLSDLLGSPRYRGRGAANEVAYATAKVVRDHDGEAELSLASDGRIEVWVNGAEVHRVTAPRPFVPDQDRVPVRLSKGDNVILVKLEHTSGSWRLAARVLEPGQALPLSLDLEAGLADDGRGGLRVRIPAGPGPAPVHVAAVAAGGRVLEEADAARGDTVALHPGAWPDGPYEVRVTARDPWGKPQTTHLIGYKGDARIAAQGLLDAARAQPATPAGDSVRMLADLVRDRLGDAAADAPDDAWPSIHSVLMEYAELAQPPRAYGFVRLAYADPVDGSTQFCRAFLPPSYDPARPSPAVIILHGYNPPNPAYVGWWSIDQRHDSTADRHDVIVLQPHGRGNSQYLGIGEQDVLRCLAEAKRRFSVDDDRVYLTGESMGGSGTWLIASHHPELFAAAAPVFGGWDYRLLPGAGFDSPRATELPERFAAEAQSSFAGAEGLLNLPLLVTHGDSDQTVPVAHSRHAAKMLQRWGYDLRYQEIPGRGHEELNVRDDLVDWLLSHRRTPAPREVRIRSTSLDNAGAHWLRVQAFQAPLQVIQADAQVLQPGLIRLDTQNVAAVRLSPPPPLRGSGPLRIVWNGAARTVMPDADGAITLLAPGSTTGPNDKRPGLQGGLSDLIATPFAIVVGTASRDPRMRQLCRQKAAALARRWTAWQHVPPRVIDDTALTREDEQRYSLLLIGGSDANQVARRLAARLPLKVAPDAITVDGKRIPARDAVVQMIHPNP
ncbi:MAG: prolyl oligopeptidase family serine peptidase, partial [Phenylobacterium sp.]